MEPTICSARQSRRGDARPQTIGRHPEANPHGQETLAKHIFFFFLGGGGRKDERYDLKTERKKRREKTGRAQSDESFTRR